MAFPDSTSSSKKIVRASNPRGIFWEGTIASGETPKPGTVMQIQASAGKDDNGRPTFEIYNRDADGDHPKGPLFVLCEKWWEGKDSSVAYAAGDHCQCYVPVAGELLNMLISNLAGTADDHAFGELLMVDDGTGELIVTTGTPETESFMYYGDGITDPTADTLDLVIFNG